MPLRKDIDQRTDALAKRIQSLRFVPVGHGFWDFDSAIAEYATLLGLEGRVYGAAMMAMTILQFLIRPL